MTIRDVLRETAGGSATHDQEALDDKKHSKPSGLFAPGAKSRKMLTTVFGTVRQGPVGVFRRLAVITCFICIASILVLTARELLAPHAVRKVAALSAQRPVADQGLSPDQQEVLRLMPAQLGDWTRSESQLDLFKDQNVGNSTVETYVSTYKNGAGRAQLWVVRAPAFRNSSPLESFEGTTRAVHTDNGVVFVSPQTFDRGEQKIVSFDFTPDSSDEQYWILTNQTFAPQSPHTQSWYEAPYVITVGANSKDELDELVQAFIQAKL